MENGRKWHFSDFFLVEAEHVRSAPEKMLPSAAISQVVPDKVAAEGY